MFGNPGKIELFVKVTHLKFDLIIYPMASFDPYFQSQLTKS